MKMQENGAKPCLQVYLKLETTGYPGDQIVEIGALVLHEGQLKGFHRYVKTTVPISSEVTRRFHGMRLVRKICKRSSYTFYILKVKNLLFECS